MKYFAILKDSLRETIDSKVLYVLLVLSTLAIVFVASVSFTPGTAEQTYRQFTQSFFHYNFRNPSGSSRFYYGQPEAFHFEKTELLKGEADSPLSEYAVHMVYHVDHNKGGVSVEDSHPPPVKDPGVDPNNGGPPKVAGPTKAAIEARAKLIAERVALAKEKCEQLFRKAQELGLVDVEKVEVATPGLGENASSLKVKVTVKGTPRTYRLWSNRSTFFFGALNGGDSMLGGQIFALAARVIFIGSWGALVLGVVITSFFIPNMLRKGTVDLLLTKPIHRSALLVYKYLGGLAFIFLLSTYAVAGIWIALAIRTGFWAPEVLLLIPITTFFFAILYAISAFMAVMTRSSITCILVTCACWLLFAIIGTIAQEMQPETSDQFGNRVVVQEDPGTFVRVVTIAKTVSPRTADLNSLNTLILYCTYVTGSLSDMQSFGTDASPWWESLLVSSAWIAVFVGLSCLWFSTKDY